MPDETILSISESSSSKNSESYDSTYGNENDDTYDSGESYGPSFGNGGDSYGSQYGSGSSLEDFFSFLW